MWLGPCCSLWLEVKPRLSFLYLGPGPRVGSPFPAVYTSPNSTLTSFLFRLLFLPLIRKQSSSVAAGAARSGGYTAFMRQRWAELKAADPDAVYREAVKGIAAEWRALGPEAQERYVQAAAAKLEAGPAASAAGDKGAAVPSGMSAPKRATPASPSAETAAKGSGRGGNRTSSKRAPAVAAGRTAATKSAAAAATATSRARPNPYMAFCREQRPMLQATNPDSSLGEISKLLGAAWGALSDAEKAAYR